MPKQASCRRVPAKDRIRISRACTACRNRKSRCVASSANACQRCEASNQVCIFDENERPRETNSPFQRFSPRGTSQQVLSPKNDPEIRVLDSATDENHQICSNNATQESETTRRPVGTSESLDGELEGAILLVEDPGRTQYTGLRSNESFLLGVRDVLQANSEKGASESRESLHPNKHAKTPQIVQSKAVKEALLQFPPQEISAFLVSTFFYYVEATFFYCDREWFHSTLASVYSKKNPTNAADDAFVCLALLIFAFGSQFAHLQCGTKSQEPLLSIEDPGKIFYEVAQTLIPSIIAKCTLKGIQVCLLAGLYNLPSNLPDTAYLYLGMAVRMSIASGLHRKTSEASLNPRVREVRNRLWWSVYCIDKRASIALGRPASIAEEDIDASFPKYHHSLDDLEYQSNVQHQVEYIKLTRIVNKIMQNIPLESKPTIISDLSNQLKQWRSELFTKLHSNDLLPSERNFRTTIHLHVHYHWAWIRMGRASLLHLSRERLLSLSGSSLPPSRQSQSQLELARLAIDAAKATIQLILVLKKHNLLCRFSYTDHQAPAAALIILVLNSILQPSVDTSGTIDEGVEMLRFMAHGGCRGAKSDLQTIEQFKAFASALRQRIYQGQSETSSGGQPKTNLQATTSTTADNYQSWVKWMSEREAEPVESTSVPGPSSSQRIEVPDVNTPSLDMFYSHDHLGNFGIDPSAGQNFGFESSGQDIFQGFEWDDKRLEMFDITQLLTRYTQ